MPKEKVERSTLNNEHKLVIQTEQSAMQNSLMFEDIQSSIRDIISNQDDIQLQISEHQKLLSQLSQKYNAIIRVIRKGDVEGNPDGTDAS